AGLTVYEPRIHELREEELSLLSELRQALDQGHLRLVYQPKVSVGRGEVTGVEALVRWMHPQKGAIPPDRFIPFAEQTGFIRTIRPAPKDRPLVLSTIDLAHNLGLGIVAEGVEDQATADLLRDLGCDEMQGYLIAKPLEPSALETWLATRPAAKLLS